MVGRVSLVGAGPGDPELWTLRAVRHLQEADLVLYDSLVDARALRRFTKAQCFCVGKRAGRESVRQETIHRLMIRAARAGKCVVYGMLTRFPFTVPVSVTLPPVPL